MKLGLMVYSTKTGLGYQTKSYYKHLNPVKVMHVDLSPLNGVAQNKDWYDEDRTTYVQGYPTFQDIDGFLHGIDVMLFAETPLNYYFYRKAKELGIKTAVVLNWEFFDHIIYPDKPLPDLFIMPSSWHYREAKLFADNNNVRIKHLHHPVDREEIPFRQRIIPKTFHIAGKYATNDRNGTFDYLKAIPDGTVITQTSDLVHRISRTYRHCRIVQGVEDHKQLYNYGDIMVLPRRYGGNCLPLNEALSAGCPVVMPNISPNSDLLPKEWLVQAEQYDSFTPRTKIEIYASNIQNLKDTIASIDITKASQQANEIAETISWSVMKSKYLETLELL